MFKSMFSPVSARVEPRIDETRGEVLVRVVEGDESQKIEFDT